MARDDDPEAMYYISRVNQEPHPPDSQHLIWIETTQILCSSSYHHRPDAFSLGKEEIAAMAGNAAELQMLLLFKKLPNG